MNILYTREGCPACIKAKEILSSQGMPFEEVVKPTGIVPILVGQDTGDYYTIMNMHGQYRFVKSNVKESVV